MVDKRVVSRHAELSRAWLGNGSAMGERVRGLDWSQTPLGPIGGWAPHLRLAAALCLDSGFPAAVYWGPEFALLYNDAYAAILGDKHPSVLGLPAREVWSAVPASIEPRLRQVAASGKPMGERDVPLCLRTDAPREERYFDSTLVPIRSVGGEVEGIYHAAHESTDRVLTARRAAEMMRAGEERLRYVTEAAGVGCWDWDVVADRGECTQRCREIFSLPPDKPISYGCFLNSLDPEDRSRVDAAMQRALARGGDYDVEYRVIWPDGSLHWVESRGRVEFGGDGRPLRMAGVVVDITARKASEAALEAHKARLEEEVAARTVQLTAANKELQAFTYGVAHDLKSPLRGIISYSQLLAMEYRDSLAGAGAEFLDQIQKSVGRMRALIDDLLDYSRIEQGSRNIQPLDLQEAIGRVLAERADDFRRGSVELRLDIPAVTVRGNPEGVAQVLRNLIDNALKFSARSSPQVIEIGGYAAEGRCRLWVKDNGLGFDMAQHNRIFEIFQRLHRAEDIPGTGIGLALVKKAMERIGGRVWAESSPGRGATFFIELPVHVGEGIG